MSNQKNNVIEVSLSSENIEQEKIDISVLNKYQELNNKCDIIISKIKNRKSKKK